MTARPRLRLAISNIAWAPDEDDTIGAVLRREGVTGVELAPTKWRDDPYRAPVHDVAALRHAWLDRGLEVVSLQSLLFGHPELQLFGGDAARHSLMTIMHQAVDFAGALGAGVVVFGSPKNRLRGELPQSEALTVARDFFHSLGDYAAVRGVAVCIEANPPAYGGDFIMTTAEAIELCRLVDHPAVRVNGDLGGMTLAGEDPLDSITSARAWLAHFHASEPSLAELGAAADHGRAREGLAAIGYGRTVSIEMRAAADGNNVAAVERAVRLAKLAYGSGS